MNHHSINYGLFKLEKWEWKPEKDQFKVTYLAPKGGITHRMIEEIDTAALVPDNALIASLDD